MNSTKQKNKSPLKNKPLRNPGQSLDEQIDELIDEGMYKYAISAVILIVFALLEWYRFYKNIPYSPKTYTIIAIIFAFFSFFKILKTKRKIQLLKLGRDGEKEVGQFLELMREKEYKIFHDIVAKGFNIDHVIICKHGIFTVETKTFSKPIKGDAKIQYNGTQITINGREPLSDIVTQAKAEAHWLKEFFKESTGKDTKVKAVIVFPGWYVDNKQAGYNPDIWVVNPMALSKFVPNSGMSLRDEEIHLFSSTLRNFIRSV